MKTENFSDRRRTLIGMALAPFLASVAPQASAQTGSAFPTKAIRLVVGFPPGGSTDLVARVLAPALGEKLGQPVIVDNRTGMGGGIAIDAIAKSSPDGYNLVLASSGGLTAHPSLYKNLPYKPTKDFAPISLIGNTPLVLVASTRLPANNVTELIALAHKQPGKLSYGSGGQGTALHLAGELFKSMSRTDIVHVPYRGSSPALVALMSGEIDLAFMDTGTAIPQIKTGRIKVIGALGNKRSSITPDIKTLDETGLPGYNASGWFAILAPAGTPEPVVTRLNGELAALLANPQIQTRLASTYLDAASSSSKALADLIQQDTVKWSKIIKSANITLE
ncbi:Bug family tripartite tricarboxylate transporter substrate binding protein [Variovorax sp. Root411]|uniref:Bug family tripartite tricarboxylate transporter substrate binding protein n=1 Tax=Variovorax sp. Root411 TaxID=1736530 RepID=UPI000A6D2720|nr:tripartite tricarboxylate transporter substrate binding protein [Variovorax sp. Root411]